MRDLRRRLERLERALPWPRWPAAVEEVKQRCLARLHLRIGAATDQMEHPLIMKALAQLIDDTPDQAEQDRPTLRRWAEQHPELMRGTEGERDRITARLEQIAERQEAFDERRA
jgi:hypothetical protein